MQTSRKLGFLEKIATIFHDKMYGSTAVAAMIKVNHIIEFEKFKQACFVLFLKKPLLRSTLSKNGNDYFFNFNAQFENIPIKHINTNDFNQVMHEYSDDITKPFDLKRYFWRITLVTIEQEQCSYIIIGMPHTICDAKSTGSLLGDLLRTVQQIENKETFEVESDPIPDPLDIILDRTKFTKLEDENYIPEPQMHMENKCDLESLQSADVLDVIEANDFKRLLNACRKRDVTITSVLCAALTKSILDLNEHDKLELSIALDLRPYTKAHTSNEVLAFYAHQLLFKLDLANERDFWDIAKQSKSSYQKAISEYVLDSADNYDLFNIILSGLEESVKNGQFFIPYTISNVGEIDAAFAGVNRKSDVSNFYFTVRNKGLFSFFIFTSTLNGNFYLNFNSAVPSLSEETSKRLIDGVMFHLRNNLD